MRLKPLDNIHKEQIESIFILGHILRVDKVGKELMDAGNTPDPKYVEPSNFPADDLIARLGRNKITGLVGGIPFC
ncbi:MAG: hypothetical protein GY699_02195 [Desulfobacteraceae bacterium]|nr:hypothetical protein [Desulfobacteraceae bacterium]